MAPATQITYAKDEKVLCFHHELLYEAKVLDSKVKDPNDKKDGYMYRIHYKGWKNTWDDWVPQERLRKLNEENKELANNLKKDMDAQRKAATSKPIAPMQKKRPYGSDLTGSSARGSEDRSSAAPPAPPRGTKRGREIEGIDKVSHSRVFVVCTFSAVSAVSVVRPPLPIFIICSSRTALAPLSAVLVVMAPTKRPASTHPPRARQLLKTSQPAVSRSALSRAVEQRGVLTQSSKQEEEFVRRPAVRILMPDSLKSILVDDWEKVTKEQKLAQVPSPTPASQFLNDYYSAEANTREPNSADADILEEVIAGVKEYFNKSLGRILLYRFERQQFYDVHKSIESGSGEHTGKTLCEMYGCEHLLRLFVSMPDLIAHTNMDAQSVSRLREELMRMTSWMAKRIPTYLSHEYEHAGQAYLDSAKTGT